MRLSVDCPECGASFSVKPERAGMKVACKECGAKVRVPEDATALGNSTISRSGFTRRSSSRSKSQNSPGMMIGLGIGGGVGVVGIIAVLVMMSGRGNPPAAPAVPVTDSPAAGPALEVAANAVSTPAVSSAATVTAESSMPAPEIQTTPLVSTEAVPTDAPKTNVTATNSVAEPVSKPTELSVTASPTKLDLPDLIALVEPSVVRINSITPEGGGTGSGFVVDYEGTIVTNYHVMEGATRAQVEFADGTTAPVTGFRFLLSEKDIAIIDIDLPSEKLKPVAIADVLPQKGISVAAFGAPHGLSFTASDGIVSALRKAEDMLENLGAQVQGDWVQTTTPISPGNSGGPLVNMYGAVVGMNTMGRRSGQNLNFAISCVDIKAAVAAAPSQLHALKEGAIPEPKTNGPLSGDKVLDEVGTVHGAKLFSELKEIFLLNALRRSSFDPTGAIWDRVIVRSQLAVEKSGIELSFGEPAPDAALMIVHLELKPTRKGTAGTQELHIKTELICIDPFAKRAKQAVRVWKGEDVLGTISLDAALAGQVPRTADTNLAKFFQTFRTAYQKAVRDAKAATETPESDKPESSPPASSSTPQ